MGQDQSTEAAPAAEEDVKTGSESTDGEQAHASLPTKEPAMGAIAEDDDPSEECNPQATEPAEQAPSTSMIENMAADDVLTALGVCTNLGDAVAATACCRRVRVLCRDMRQRKQCDQLGAARIVVGSFDAMRDDPMLVLQSLAAVVNLCSGESHPPRTTATEAGALRAAAQAMEQHGHMIEISEMACLVVQNLCYGDDADALNRRARAGADGVINGIVTAYKRHPEIRETCIAACRLTVDRMPDLRQQAQRLGAGDDAVKPITKEGGGFLSFRGGFGTSRKRANKAKAQQESAGK